jgi:hypothetical protein
MCRKKGLKIIIKSFTNNQRRTNIVEKFYWMGGIGIRGRERRQTKQPEEKDRCFYNIPPPDRYWSGGALFL